MEKTVNMISKARWLSILFGYIMFFCTQESFGRAIGMTLGIIAAAAFWFLMGSERSRLIGQTIADEIKRAIQDTARVESFIEIKKLRSGIIARVYLIDAKEKAGMIHSAINQRLQTSAFSNYIWILQLTDMPAKTMLKDVQKRLNEQLLDELLKRNRGDEK